MRQAPRFSVLIPVFDGGDWVDGALESVLGQTWTDLEVVVADNVSSDDTRERVASHADPRVRLLTADEHVDIFANFDRGAAACRGTWLYLLPVDDRLAPTCLERIEATIQRHRSDRPLVAVFPRAARIDASGARIDALYHGAQGESRVEDGTYGASAWLAVTARPGSPPWDSGAFLRSTLDEMRTFFRTDVPSMSADLELTIRVAAYGDVAFLDEPLMAVTGSTGSHTPGRVSRNLASGERFTPRGRAYAEGLRAHADRRPVSPEEIRIVRAAIARTHLRRATGHRHLPGGRGRRGAAGDVIEALRLSPATLLRSLPQAVATILLPVPVLLALRDRTIRRHETGAGAGDTGVDGSPGR